MTAGTRRSCSVCAMEVPHRPAKQRLLLVHWRGGKRTPPEQRRRHKEDLSLRPPRRTLAEREHWQREETGGERTLAERAPAKRALAERAPASRALRGRALASRDHYQGEHREGEPYHRALAESSNGASPGRSLASMACARSVNMTLLATRRSDRTSDPLAHCPSDRFANRSH